MADCICVNVKASSACGTAQNIALFDCFLTSFSGKTLFLQVGQISHKFVFAIGPQRAFLIFSKLQL